LGGVWLEGVRLEGVRLEGVRLQEPTGRRSVLHTRLHTAPALLLLSSVPPPLAASSPTKGPSPGDRQVP
ncbi:hypothetical protein CLOM_g22307, partial [Closterium sp. NIES-68]